MIRARKKRNVGDGWWWGGHSVDWQAVGGGDGV